MLSKRLGKGLDALFPGLEVTSNDNVSKINVNELRANPYQPRKHFDDESILELSISIKEHGIIQPIIVRSVIKGFEIIAGERRWRAAQKAGLFEVPCVIRSFSDQQVMEISLIENIQRENLNAMEIANGYQLLINHYEYTQEELSLKVGKSRSHIANFLRLLNLPEIIKEYVSRGTLSMGHARALISIENEEEKLSLAEQAIKENWSVRDLEARVSEEQIDLASEKTTTKKEKAKTKESKQSVYIKDLEDQLTSKFQTTIKIKAVNDKGKIEMFFQSNDDLQRLLEMLKVTSL